ncbi:NAD(P)/FAD-dependent oxidoreductase [Paenibacillus glycanilyticus]|uniref:Ferredoxin reductase n=1 Tax=Paenibacillus glycanilyticus TaxID=126569 RepID=A0ABQ6G9T3_9BACL|nr:FAD-dependent oxidoreductase [Paenibacillus glycanilyticus]GLX67010.1 ferredoxin reductase [Paenibacillus glycanilyticus]
MTIESIVIVGAGEAGARAAIELREGGFNGEITIVGRENMHPYERPPLSKTVLLMPQTPAPATILDEQKCGAYQINLITGKEAIKIERGQKRVVFEDGSSKGYDRLLLATGANPRRLMLEGSDTSGVMYLRTYADALVLRSRLSAGKRVVVIGGGFIGLEVAASARETGCEVTLLDLAPRILMRGVPAQIAGQMESRHREAGVQFKLGTGIEQIHAPAGREHAVTLSDGTILKCDVIVAGIGAIPETTLASASGLVVDNGIVVDDQLRTSDPHIYAAGDCCSFPHHLFGGQRMRLEAWRNAVDQAIVAARNLVGGTESYAAVPWFWSDQYDKTLQVVGLPDLGCVTVERSGLNGNQLYVHLDEEGTIVAASGIGDGSLGKEIRILEKLIERRAKPSSEQLSDPAIRLKSLL